jgi:cell division protein FtsW
MVRAGQSLILLVVALLTIGMVMVNSAGDVIGSASRGSILGLLASRPALFGALAVAAMLLGSVTPVAALARLPGAASPAPWAFLVMVGLLLAVHVPGVGREVNGASRWIAIGPVGFQPSEFAKWGMPLILALYCSRHARRMGHPLVGLLLPVGLVALVCAMIVTEDLGTAVLIALAGAGVLLAGGTRLPHLLALLPLALCGLAAAVLASPYRMQRILSYLDPFGDPRSAGYHMIQSMAAISSGGLAGRGLGNGIHKFGYLPEDTTDFIFAIVAEELGVVGPILLVGLFSLILILGLRIVRGAETPFERLFGIGILMTFGLQALMNLAVVTGCAPTKGIALPLVSSGGTGWVLTAFSLGLLASMDAARTSRIAPAPIPAPQDRPLAAT